MWQKMADSLKAWADSFPLENELSIAGVFLGIGFILGIVVSCLGVILF